MARAERKRPACQQALVLSLLSIVFSWVPAGAHTLDIGVSSNFEPALQALVKGYQQRTHMPHLRIKAASSGVLYQQILQGEEIDIFFSADKLRPKLLHDGGVASRISAYVRGRLVFWAPSTSKGEQGRVDQSTWQNWQQPYVLANPLNAPYGIAAKQVISQTDGRATPVIASDVEQAYHFILADRVPAGFVSLAQVIYQPAGDYWLVPQHYYQPLEQFYAVLDETKEVSELLAFIESEEGRAILKAFGYAPLEESQASH
ncbi:molybdate ABC transporter substrate-binding protein [Aliagarivorans marinus]|uniref:molybdate ABC transporter substrate-binding protein n=1 Tax=Aliagarivorans marinus TaxID=561965 RepID=UPI00047C6A2B|nr:molybdate ABC transporter substrate-binding protein [Aliagarivorans marinus]